MGKQYFHAQNYQRLKAECIRKKQLFVDVQFPPTNDSLFLRPINPEIDIIWKRPGEIVDNPQLFVEGATANDVTQGILGNCWFVSACSALTHHQALLKKVIPDASGQEWTSSNNYCGIFRFCFWRFNQWIEIVIDDLLPTQDGKLLFARSKSSNEFWSALLEKAFAKLYGCYENLVGGQLADALEDISGGVTETINVQKQLINDPSDSSGKLFHTIKEAFDQQALIIAAIAAKNKEEIEETLECGLVKGHAYAVTAVRFIELNTKNRSFLFFTTARRQMMIRLQNPWGEKEWNGPWSDGSKEWEQVTDEHKLELGITVEEDGDFWMPWNEFIRYFTDLSVCQLFNTSLFNFGPKFYEWKFFDEWKSNNARQGALNDRAGGCINFMATFCCNPQYRFDIDVDDSEVRFALTQKVKNEGEKHREPLVTIGMHLMKVEDNRIYRIHQPINPVITSDYNNGRSAYLHCQNLRQGRYILLPTTFAPLEFAEFLLRIYSERNIAPRALKKNTPNHRGLFSCKKVNSITRITVIGVELNNINEGAIRTYVVISCDKESVRTRIVEGTKAFWNQCFIFYRRDMTYKFVIELMENRIIHDRTLGVVHIMGNVDNDTQSLEYDIIAENQSIGSLSVTIQSYDDPIYL
ncbi:calpain-5 [Loa loa]|uniref:Calpain-5 n=1 Tax=Loa loa TaxID=7209 RepID=A0A1I7VNY3_LOALO|nr:calpain-5 [Loa loa]EJD74438.1 calpain-5 [Loa loa]